MNYLELHMDLGFMAARARMNAYRVLQSGDSSLRALRLFKFAYECDAFIDSICRRVSVEIQNM